jgi:SAM-dependent methyltransferase
MFERGVEDSINNLLALLPNDPSAFCLDLGCGDGKWVLIFGNHLGTRHIVGIEGSDVLARRALTRGITVLVADLYNRFPLRDASFDVVISNYSLEHLARTGQFVQEIYRVLRPHGIAVISTDNLSSWANIFPLVFGYQPFCLTSGIADLPVGNPWALHRNEVNTTMICPQENALLALGDTFEFFRTRHFEKYSRSTGSI